MTLVLTNAVESRFLGEPPGEIGMPRGSRSQGENYREVLSKESDINWFEKLIGSFEKHRVREIRKLLLLASAKFPARK